MGSMVGCFSVAGPLVPCSQQIKLMHHSLVKSKSNPGQAQAFTDHRFAAQVSAAQLYESLDHDLVICFAGKLEACEHLAQKLSISLDQFQSTAHLLAELYHARGLLIFQQLQGDFLICLWDKTRQRLVLARDPLGIEDLYYCQDGDDLWFATSPQPLAEFAISNPRLSPVGLNMILTGGFAHSGEQPIEGIKQLMPGELMVVEKGQKRTSRYWQWLYGQDHYHNANAQELEHLICQQVRKCSPTSAAMISINNKTLDESIAARSSHHIVDENLGSHIIQSLCGNNNLTQVANAPQIFAHTGTEADFINCVNGVGAPAFHTNAWQLWTILAEHAGQSCVSASGAAELFANRHYFKEVRMDAFCRRHPNLIDTQLSDKLFASSRFYHDRQGPLGTGYWAEFASNKTMLSDEFAEYLAEANKPWHVQLPEEAAHWTTLEVAQYQVVHHQLIPWMSQVQRLADINEVQLSHPLYNHLIVQWCLGVPSRKHMRGVQGNQLLKTAFESLLGESVYNNVNSRQARRKTKSPFDLDALRDLSTYQRALENIVQQPWVHARLDQLALHSRLFNQVKLQSLLDRVSHNSVKTLSLNDLQALQFCLSLSVFGQKNNIAV